MQFDVCCARSNNNLFLSSYDCDYLPFMFDILIILLVEYFFSVSFLFLLFVCLHVST